MRKPRPNTYNPAQALHLYIRNIFRIIADVNAEPVETKAGTWLPV